MPKPPRTLDEAIRELKRRLPLTLDAETTQKINGKNESVSFTDDHLFIVGIPAWVLRTIKNHK